MKKSSRKIRKQKKKVVYLQSSSKHEPTFCGARLVVANHNRLWRWDSLEEVQV